MAASFAIFAAVFCVVILVGAVFTVFMRNQKKDVKPRVRDEHGAPLAEDSSSTRRARSK